MNNLWDLNKEQLIASLRSCYIRCDKAGAWTQLVRAFSPTSRFVPMDGGESEMAEEFLCRISELTNERDSWREKYEKVKSSYDEAIETLENVRRWAVSHS